MNPLLLKTLHLAGAFVLFTSLGASLLAGSGKKSVTILHGISLLLIVIAGFAMLKKPPMGQSWWMIKLGLWLFIGLAPLLNKHKLLLVSGVFLLWGSLVAYTVWLQIERMAIKPIHWAAILIGAATLYATFSKRKVLPAPLVLVLTIAAATTAAWLGLRKPF